MTGTGEIVRLGRRTAKGVAGYDLAGLFVGSEGTLGVITEVTVRLRPLPAAPVTVAGYFSSVIKAGEAVREVRELGLVPSVFELIDRYCLRAVDAWKRMGLSVDADVVLLAQFDDGGAAADEAAGRAVACFERAGASWADRSSDPQQAEALFAARRLAYPALERLGPVLTEDVCVPLTQVPAMLARIDAIAERHGLTIANIAHVGDGNLHPLIIVDAADASGRERAQDAFHEILNGALDLGGTITGEHGVGLTKRPGLDRELSSVAMDMHRAVKHALDPAGIMNPGKIFDS